MRRLISRIVSLALTVLPALAFLGVADCRAQILTVENQREFSDSLRKDIYKAPYFGLYKDNYFIVGTVLGAKPTRTNSDVKFQISIAQRLTRTTLPLHSYIFLMYTQKTFWNVFEESLPMRDMNFNPGLGWTFPFFTKGRYFGQATLLIEHESNGRDGDASRSWNRISFCGSAMINDMITVNAKYWIPIIDGMNNRDILDYCGIFQTGVSVTSPNKKLGWSLMLTKRRGWNLNFNTVVEFNFKIHEKTNQFLFVQYYNGYGENLLDYNKFHSRIRAGIVIKPPFFSTF